MLGRLAREPLLHFLVLGALFFVFFGRGDTSSVPEESQIVVTAADIDRIAAGFATTWQRPPSDKELQGAINDYVREEVLYRAGVSMGLDKDDTIVRRRIRQKMDFFFEDTVGAPQEAELRAFFAANADKFRTEPRIAFRQVFVSSERRDPKADAAAMLPHLVALGPDAGSAGDPLLLPEEFGPTALSEIRSQFGDDFARDIATAPPGSWAGPLQSAYGYHLVLVKAVEPGGLPPFEEVRAAVEREWFAARRAAVLDEQYRTLLSHYHVRLDYPGAAPEK